MAETNGNEPTSQRTRAAEYRRRHAAVLPGLRDVGEYRARAAADSRRPQARASPHFVRDVPHRAALEPPLHQVRRRRGRGARAVPSARRHGGLRFAGPHGAAVQPPLPADRRPGKFRIGRRRSARRVSIHRVQADAAGRADARRYRQGHRRLRPELRRLAHGARDSAGAVSEPAGERLRRHRGRHGDQYPAAQSRRGLRRAAGAHQQAGHHARGNPRHHTGAGFSDRRTAARPRGDSTGVPNRPRHAHDARSGEPSRPTSAARDRRSSFAKFPTR